MYVSDLELRLSGGGSYSVNWHAFDQLGKRFAVQYAGPLVPEPPWIEQTESRIRRRVLKIAGRFAYFSPATLDRNARLAEAHFTPGNDAVVFRSATRWCRCRPRIPYFIYLDAVFHTFFHNTFDAQDFLAADVERIWKEEAAFLEGAAGVFFESSWGLDQARAAYNLRGDHYFAPGRGGAIEPPARDSWTGATRSLVTVAMNFHQKGGDLVLEAYKLLLPRFPHLTWHVIGAPPEGDWRSLGGISHEGVLEPDDTHDRSRLARLLSDAFLIVHPTREDTSPLVLTEAAYFGCPAVSVNLFAIPELVANGETGVLLDSPVTPQAIASAIADLLTDDSRYGTMRREARSRSLQRFSWDAVGSFICDRIDERLGAAGESSSPPA